MKTLFCLVIIIFLLSSATPGTSQGENISSESKQEDIQSDNSSPDNLVKALYESISFEENSEPDFERLTKLFTPDVKLRRIGNNKVLSMTLDEFTDKIRQSMKEGLLLAFSEKPTYTKIEVSGDLASAKSTYKSVTLSKDGNHVKEGTNLFLFGKYNNKWLICSIIWSDNIL